MGFCPSRCSFAPLLGAQTGRTVAQTLCVDVARSVDSEQRARRSAGQSRARHSLRDSRDRHCRLASRALGSRSHLLRSWAQPTRRPRSPHSAQRRPAFCSPSCAPKRSRIYASPSTVSRTSGARITLGFRSRSSIRILCSATSRARYPSDQARHGCAGECDGVDPPRADRVDRRTAVKLSSPGPFLYRQKRIGQYGVPFTCLKFGSMYTGNDPRILYQGTVVRSRARASRRSVFTWRARVVIYYATLVTVPESHAA